MIKSILNTLLLLLACTICGQAQEKISVVASASIFADMAEQIGGDKIEVKSIVPIGSDPHLHSPVPSDVKKVSQADLILVNSLTFEGWIAEVIDNSGTKAKIDTITKGINPIESKEYKGSADPHAWMRADNGRIYARNISNALQAVDPANAKTYQKNFELFDAKIQETHNYISEAINSIPVEQRILITSHDAFAYYGQAYDIRLEPIIGISTEAQVQTSDISRVTKVIRESGVPNIFVESTINPKLLKQLAADNGVGIGGELFADSLDEKDKPAGTYLGMLRTNTDVIVKALSEEKKAIQETENSGFAGLGVIFGILAVLLIASLIFYFINKK